jgi:nitrogen fixation protein FixH
LNGASTGIPFTTQGIDLEVTLTGTTTYAAKVRAGGTLYAFSGNLQNQSNKTISKFRSWNYNAGNDNNLLVQNLSVVTKTLSAPVFYSSNQTITVSLAGDAEFKAVFEEIPPEPERQLMHYWNFNNTGTLLTPTYTIGGATWSVSNGPTTEVTSGTGQDFFGENARNGDAASSHLRVNNPIGATMSIKLPTTGYEDIIVKYETRRSGSGAGSQIVDYTLDGTNYTNYTTISPVDGTPVLYSLDFSAVSGVDDNPNFGVQVTYAQGGGGTVGNNRFDNFTVEGVALPLPSLPPVVVANPGLQFLIENDTATLIDLYTVFDDPNNDPLTFTAQSDNTNVLLAGISGDDLVLAPELRGQATVTITADDGDNAPVQTTFRVLVYPEPSILELGASTFTQWFTNQAAGTYPQNMIFLQGVENDSTITSKFEYAYHIPLADAAVTNDVNFPYAATSRTRINGLGTNGVSFINTGRGRDLGAALMAIDTLNLSGARVTWTGGTVTPNVRVYAVRLQYRVGVDGPFQNVLNGTNVVEYVRNATTGHSQVIGPISLPSEAIDKEYVQLLWRYYLVSGTSGARAELRVDNILVEEE